MNLYYSYRQQRARRRRPGRRPTPPANAAAPTVRGRDLRSRRRLVVRIRDEVRSRGRMGGLVLFLVVVIGLFIAIQLMGWLRGSAEHPNLVAAVAPFAAPDGGVAPEGASVQQGMVFEWSQGQNHRLSRPLQLLSLNDPVPDAQAALTIAQRERADVVIWGGVEPGGSANSASLRPLLLWWPRQLPPHARAFGLQERLVLPAVYDLALNPLNGEVVLGQILDTLDLYQMGDYDGTVQAINTLLNRYAVDGPLRPDLLLGVRGAIAAMQQQWASAESDYREAIAATQPGRPEYWNNLGVALLAQGRTDDAIQAFNTARTLLTDTGSDLAAIHLNTGLLLLGGPDPAAALPSLARAHELAPRSAITLVALAEAQTKANQFGPAIESINLASELAPDDPLVALGLSRVQLAQLVGTGDRTGWELEIAPPLPQEPLAQMRTRLDGAVVTLETLATAQRAQATSSDAAGRPETGRVYEGAALQQSALLEQVRYWRAVILTEEGVAAQAQPRGWLSRTWQSLFGDDPPLEQALQTLQPLVRAKESDYDLRVQLARANRLLGIAKPALENYTRAAELAPNRPEAWYGVAITRWQSEAESDERNQAIRDALGKSIAADSRYTPAYLLCARLEIRQKQWQAALPCLEWLHANRPDQT
ncbi:MAG TPA: tetratricopeptide repeat protein, partial [Herpetosiphonaceae bacterium]|nr:tetratricopeptide repeat protein [Herpetosiphonaceae bacterium]